MIRLFSCGIATLVLALAAGRAGQAQNAPSVAPTYYYSERTVLVWVSHHYIVDTIRAYGYPLKYDLYIWEPAKFRSCIKYSSASDQRNLTFEDMNQPLFVGSVIVEADHGLTIAIADSPGKRCLLPVLEENIRPDGELAFSMVNTFSHHPMIDEIRNPTGRPPEVRLVETRPGQIEWPVFLAVLLHHKGGFNIYLNGVRLWETFLQGYIKLTPQPPKTLPP